MFKIENLNDRYSFLERLIIYVMLEKGEVFKEVGLAWTLLLNFK